mgnify:CR=1 FL=1|jgi:hypothetical protein|tara:strand:+ start:771 stop:1400 length:630 start_codon:yes stop_codon:yes gene_type:complete
MKDKIKLNSEKMPKGLIEFYAMRVIYNFSYRIWAPLIAVFVLALGGSMLHLGQLIAVFGVSYAAGSYIIAKIGIRFRYKILPIFYGLICIYSLALIFVTSIDQLYVVIGFGSLSSSIMGPGNQGIPLDFIESKWYVLFQQRLMMALALIAAIAGYLGGLYIHHSHTPTPHITHEISVFREIFITMFTFNLILFFYSFYFLKRYNLKKSY